MHSATDARYLGARDHAIRLIEAAEQLAEHGGEAYERLAERYATLGYRGHPITKTHRYSTTFKALRQARRDWHNRPRRPTAVDPAELPADDDPDGDDADVIVESAVGLRRHRLPDDRAGGPGAGLGGRGAGAGTEPEALNALPPCRPGRPSLTGGAGGSRP